VGPKGVRPNFVWGPNGGGEEISPISQNLGGGLSKKGRKKKRGREGAICKHTNVGPPKISGETLDTEEPPAISVVS